MDSGADIWAASFAFWAVASIARELESHRSLQHHWLVFLSVFDYPQFQ